MNWLLCIIQEMPPVAKYSHTMGPFKNPAYFNNKGCFCFQTADCLAQLL